MRRDAAVRAISMAVTLAGSGGCGAPGAAMGSPDSPRPELCSRMERPGQLEVVILGSGGPRAAGRAAASYLIVVGGRPRVLVDVGPGSFARLGEMDVDHRALDTVLLTHLHIDHAGELPGFVKSRDLAYDQPASFRIVGPSGRGDYPSTSQLIDRLFGPEGAFAYLAAFRNPLSFDVLDLPLEQDHPAMEVSTPSGARVRAVPVDHGDVPAVAYRVELAGHSVVITGDLASKNDNVAKLARGADLLIFDGAVLDPPGSPPNLYDLHTAPARIGEVAAQAGVRELVVSHIAPAGEAQKAETEASIRRSFHGRITFAADCQRHVLVP